MSVLRKVHHPIRVVLQAVLALVAMIAVFASPADVTADPDSTSTPAIVSGTAPLLAEPSLSGNGELVYFDRATVTGALSGGTALVDGGAALTSSDSFVGIAGAPTVIRDSGPSSNRVDIVFLPDGYTQGELGNYANTVNQVLGGAFLQIPLYEYTNYFNVHRLDLASTESGVDNDPALGIAKDTVLDSQFWCQGVESTLCADVAKSWQYAGQSRDADQIVVLVNSTKAGASAYPFSDLAVLSGGQPLVTESFLHQFGHSFANLADEFDTGSWPDYTGYEPAEPNVSPQTAESMTAQRIKWYRWLGIDLGAQFGGVVGAYEGAMGHLRGIRRPTSNSKMRTLGAPFNAPSVESFIAQIYRVVSPIDDATPANPALTGADTLTVKPLQPIGRNLDIQWFANGNAIPGATGKTFRAHDYPLADGTYTISVVVTDNTSMMKDEAFRSQYMTASRSWVIPVDENPPIIITHPANQTVYPGQSATFSVVATGDGLRYQWRRNGVSIAGATGASYTLSNVARSDSGATFSVVVSNVAGSVTSNNAVLTVGNRPPVLVTVPNQLMSRNQTLTVPLTVSDPDGDVVTITAAVEPQAINPGAQVSVQGTSLQIKTNLTYIGSFSITITATDSRDTVRQTFSVTVGNQAPVIQPIPQQDMKWRTDLITVPLTASDSDGDAISFTAAIDPPGSAPVTLSIANGQLTINPSTGYVGIFNVKVNASDGYSTSSTLFTVNVYNTIPTLQTIANQSMYWKTDSISVPIVASDPDGDPLIYSYGLAAGETAPVSLSMSGTNLIINPANTYIGVFSVVVSVSDTKRSVSQTFSVNVYNSAPTIQWIFDRRMHYKVDSIDVPVTATDPDGDPITITAGLAPGETAPVVVTVQGTKVNVNPAADYLGTFRVRVRASDNTAYTEQIFSVTVYNSAPILGPIGNQWMHWLKEDTRDVQLTVSDPDGELVTVSAEVMGTVRPTPILTMTGATSKATGTIVRLNPADRFLGDFVVKVTATDGALSDIRTFLVTVGNHAPEMEPICDRSLSWTEFPTTITLRATDPDDEPLTFTARVEESTIAYDLDKKYNFARTDVSWNYNLLGLGEKYLQGDKNQPGSSFWFMILPSGEVYESRGSLASSTLVASLPVAFYNDPTLLIDVPAPDPTAPPVSSIVSATVQANVLTISAPAEYRGTFRVGARASDGHLFDDESFLVTVYDGAMLLEPIPTVRMHWTEDSRTLNLVGRDADGTPGGAPITFAARFADTSLAYGLDQQNHFGRTTDRSLYTQDNARGRAERYVLGGSTVGALNTLFAILPNGELYRCIGSRNSANIDNSVFLTRLPPAYYVEPTLLFDVPPPKDPPVALTVTGNRLVVDPEPHFSGASLVAVTASSGLASDTQYFMLDVYNNAPTIVRVPADASPVVDLSWTSDTSSIPFAPGDVDAQDRPQLVLSATVSNLAWELFDLDQQYDFTVAPEGLRWNEAGWREKHLTGFIDGVATDFVILPSGALYRWTTSPRDSVLVASLPTSNFDFPTSLLNVPSPLGARGPAEVQVRTSGTSLIIDPPPSYLGSFQVLVRTSDGDRTGFYSLSVDVRNHPPVLGLLPDLTMHWRTDIDGVNVSAIDPDGEPVRLLPVLSLPGQSANPVPVTLSMSQNRFLVDPIAGFTGSFQAYVIATTDPVGTPQTFGPLSSFTPLKVRVYNSAPSLTAIGARQNPYRQRLSVALSSADADAADRPYLAYTAWLGTTQHRAYQLAQLYRFGPAAGGVNTNARGFGEKYVAGLKNGSAATFVILPSGDIYEWTGSLPFTNRIGHVAQTYYNDLTQLYSPGAPAALPNFDVSVSGGTLTVDPKTTGYVGSVPVTVEVTDGNLTASETFTLTEFNSAPVIQQIANQTVGWKQSYSTTVTVSDPDNDAVTLTAYAEDANQLIVTLSGRTLTVTPRTPFVGSGKVWLSATDGMLVTKSSFTMTYVNRAPVLNAIPLQTIRWNERARSITLSATDPDGDAITYSAAVTVNPQAATLSLVGPVLTMTLRSYVDTFYVTAYATDGATSVSQTFRVNLVNSAPTISGIQPQTVNWSVPSLVLPIAIDDIDGDVLQISAQAAPGATLTPTFSISRTQLVIGLPNRTTGSFTVDVRASDGVFTAVRSFTVNVTNGAPVLLPIADQIIGFGAARAVVPMIASDPDNNPLTYSAELLSEQRLIYELDRGNNFELRTADFQFNKLGNGEKYFQGTKNLVGSVFTYVIYPNGRLYEWSGQLTTSRFLATVPVPYYTDPRRLFDVPAPTNTAVSAQLTLSGSDITITPNASFIGKFWVLASVTDTLATAKAIFSVSVEDEYDNGGGSGDSEDGCQTRLGVYNGDFTSSGSRAFSGEVRIGDGANGPKTRTHELSAGSQTAPLTWQSGQRVPFSLSYDPDHGIIRLVVNGVVVSQTLAANTSFTDVLLRATSRYDTDSIVLDQILLNGRALGASVGASVSLGGTNVLQIRSALLNSRFTLEGSLVLRYGSNAQQLAKDSELGLQVSAGNVEGHPTRCGDDGERKVTICHIPPGNPDVHHTIRVGRSALKAHLAHGDVIGECPGSPSDPGDGGGTCEQKKIISSPNYTLWNSYLGMMNILELTNSGETDMPVTISFYSILGELAYRTTINVPAINQFDVIINDLPGFVRDSYGIVKLEFYGPLDGRMMYYRQSADGYGYDFAFDMPLNDPTFGTTAVSFNTNQPSIKPEERQNMVANWLSIVNLEPQEEQYLVYTYDANGHLLLKRSIAVPSFGRADVDGGHELAGLGVVGVHIIVPKHETAEYIAMLSRFGGDAPAGYAPSKYKFAFPVAAKHGQSDPIYAPISNRFDEFNWIEVVNILDDYVPVTINFYARDGGLLESLEATLDPHAQWHFNASAYLGGHETGYTEIVPKKAYSVIAQSMGYLRDPNSGSVTAAYASQARRALPCLQSGSYNLYLNMQDWILVANTTNETLAASIQLTGPNLLSEKTVSLPPRGSVYLPIHDITQFGAKPNTYGLIAVRASDPSKRLFAEVMRVRFRSNGSPDFAAPTPVR